MTSAPRAAVRELIAAHARTDPTRPAIAGPGRRPIPRARLLEHVDGIRGLLRAHGVGRADRVAIVLPGGPEAAVAFLGVASGAAAAPLDPALTGPEMTRRLERLRARAMVVGDHPVAETAASRLGVEVLKLPPSPEAWPAGGETDPGEGDEVALVLQTSGTTGRPKLVPLTHANLTASACGIAAGLELTPRDRCLDVMPLFHVHGLVGGLLASLAAGASVVCPPAFTAPAFLDWVAAFAPTWYTAAPAIHHAVLSNAARRAAPVSWPFRFVRSCSAPLSAALQASLEELFGAPVIQAYGMTEACHQIASNPLPPGRRMPGSVGTPVGTEIAILDGEIAVRGPGVMSGYDDPEANATAFAGEWLRTGDLGHLDGAGYLYITGRLREVINRGGEKVSPLEVEEAVAAHPAVLEAAAFGLPDARLGEEVGVAVVPRPGAAVTEAELRAFLEPRLSAFALPRRIAFVADLPRGATGKLQRRRLADEIGAAPTAPSPPVGSPALRCRVAAAWSAVLGLADVEATADFFDLGGTSRLAEELIAGLRLELGVELTVADLLEAPTVAALAASVERRAAT